MALLSVLSSGLLTSCIMTYTQIKKSLQMALTNVYCLGSARKLLSVKQKSRT